jgi:hypothetical protein
MITQRRRRYKKGGFQEFFPESDDVDYSHLQITEEGTYSITKRNDGRRIMERIRAVIGNPKRKTITDATGNVGGDTILFGLNFKKVDSIELNPENFKVLKNNVDVYGLKNVTLHQGDSTKIFDWKTDVLYIDAPWGGPSYKEKTNLDLFLGSVNMVDWLKDILQRENRPRFVFLKTPRNFNFDSLEDLPNIEHTYNFKIRGYNLVGMVIKTR